MLLANLENLVAPLFIINWAYGRVLVQNASSYFPINTYHTSLIYLSLLIFRPCQGRLGGVS